MKRFLLPLLMVFAIAALLVGTAPANAAFTLKLTDLTNSDTITIVDGDGNDTLPGIAGVISWSGSLGAFDINVTTGTSKPIIGNASLAKIDLNSADTSSNVVDPGLLPAILEIMLTDTDFLLSTQNAPTSLLSHIGGTTDGTVEYQQIFDPENLAFAEGSSTAVVISGGPFPAGAFSEDKSALIFLGEDPFSLTEIVTITHNNPGDITSFDIESNVVPEPGTMLLIGTGLLGLAGLGRRKLRKK